MTCTRVALEGRCIHGIFGFFGSSGLGSVSKSQEVPKLISSAMLFLSRY